MSSSLTAGVRRARWAQILASVLLSLLLVGLNLLAWRWANPELPAAQAQLPVHGLAYNGFQRWQSPLEQQWPQAPQQGADLDALSALSTRLRTYSSSEMPGFVDLARQRGLRITAGVWLDRQDARNERELQAIEQAVRADAMVASAQAAVAAADGAAAGPARVIERVIAGNETLLHGVLSRSELGAVLQRLRGSLDVPVSTAEPWHVWLAEPDLVEQVDFIAVHLLPYWEGVPSDVAVHEVWRRFDEVRQRYPHKPVLIAEVGWPSGGPLVEKRVHGSLNRASATPIEQARFLREFVASAQRRGQGVEYFLMEAIDQPWKVQTEGAAGAHWGVLDARRQAKFDWMGPVERDPYWRGKAAAAALLGLLVLWPFLLKFPHMRLSGRLSFGISAQATASLTVVLATLPLVDYLRLLDALLLAMLVPALMLMAAILLCHAFEFSELFWEGSLRRRLAARGRAGGIDPPPMVSIHLACCNEPPDMVLATLRSLQALEWPRLEILIVDNNTTDQACWKPVADYIAAQRAQGDRRLQFVHLPQWPGYKAGALNKALSMTDPQAAWVAVVDADYIVHPQWIARLAGWFEEPDVAVVQSPQAHRAWAHDRLARMMNWEYEGFFRLGMHHRHERNAIVQHGTMTMIRSAALREVGGWEESCVCEDTELGLRLLAAGWRKLYVDEVLGAGLVPHDFAAYQGQRERWARGGMQILRRHAASLWGPSRLTLGQRYHFMAGWLPWLGDTLHLLFTLTALVWSLGVMLAPASFALPQPLLAAPLLVFFLARLVLVPLLYLRRVQCPAADVLGAAWAGMALSHRIARGVLAGLFGGTARFAITRKSSIEVDSRPAAPGPNGVSVHRASGMDFARSLWRSSVAQEGLLLGLLWSTVVALFVWAPAATLPLVAWGLILAVQSLPYAAALTCAALGRRNLQPAPKAGMAV